MFTIGKYHQLDNIAQRLFPILEFFPSVHCFVLCLGRKVVHLEFGIEWAPWNWVDDAIRRIQKSFSSLNFFYFYTSVCVFYLESIYRCENTVLFIFLGRFLWNCGNAHTQTTIICFERKRAFWNNKHLTVWFDMFHWFFSKHSYFFDHFQRLDSTDFEMIMMNRNCLEPKSSMLNMMNRLIDGTQVCIRIKQTNCSWFIHFHWLYGTPLDKQTTYVLCMPHENTHRK